MSFELLKLLLKGFSQIMLQNSALTGLMFLIGICFNSPIMAAAGLLGCATSTTTAWFLNCSVQDLSDGLYGFNGTLIGIALTYFFELTPILTLFIILGAAASTMMMNFMQRKLPPLTFPFVSITWVLYFLISIGTLAPPNVSAAGIAPTITSVALMGFGQVMFQANGVTGALFFLGIALNAPKSAAFALIGNFVGVLIAYALGQDPPAILLGVFSLNPILCALAFEKKGIVFAILASALSTFLTIAFMELPMPGLTLPFLVTTWMGLVARKLSIPR